MGGVSAADIEAKLNEIIALSETASGSPLLSVYRVDAETRKALETDASLSISSNRILTQLADGAELGKISRLLDTVLDVCAPDSGNTSLFFQLLETTLSMLSIASCEEFLPYLETRHAKISELAQGPNSIVLLRTCKSLLSRLNPALSGEHVGRVLQFLGAVKGFGHPSRLNKRGKVASFDDADLELLANDDGTDITPFKASQILHDLHKLPPSDLLNFLLFLHKKLQKRFNSKVDNVESATFDLRGWNWSDWIPISAYRLLAEEVLIALSTITASAKENEELRTIISKLTTQAEKILEKDFKKKLTRVFTSEQNWREWKQAQCPYIDVQPDVSVIAAHLDASNPLELQTAGENDEQRDLLAYIGNERLTRLLKTHVGLDQFKNKLIPQQEAIEYEQKAHSTEDRSYRECLEFLARRHESWSQLLSKQSAEPINAHEELKVTEEQLSQEPTHHQSIKRSPSAPASEPAHKRPRISYEEDTRYQDRQRGMQGTARPLPY